LTADEVLIALERLRYGRVVRLHPESLKTFLDYKKSRVQAIVDLEEGRLKDLDRSRTTVYRYALPAATIDGVSGSLASLLAKDISVIFAAVVFASFIFLLAYFLDSRKAVEREQILQDTREAILAITIQETELSLRVS